MKKYFSLILSVLLLHTFSYASLASEPSKDEVKKAMLASQVKAAVASLGTGKSAMVRVVLDDKTKYHGHITEISGDYFVVADAKTGAAAPIAYSEVKGIKGDNLSTGAKIGIGVAIAAAVIVVFAVVAGRDNNQSPSGQIICVTSPCP